MDIGTPDWTQLADAKFWGLLVAVLAAACLICGFMVYSFKQWINSTFQQAKQRDAQMIEVAKITADRFETLARELDYYREMTLKALQSSTHATVSIDKTVQHMARIVEQCRVRGDNDANEYPD